MGEESVSAGRLPSILRASATLLLLAQAMELSKTE
jgi:hypothetical protein